MSAYPEPYKHNPETITPSGNSRTLAGRDMGKNRNMDNYRWDGSEKRESCAQKLSRGVMEQGEKTEY
jgi:hypothetical protein